MLAGMGNVYVDSAWASTGDRDAIKRRGGSVFCRLWADDLRDLHALARRIGLDRALYVGTPGCEHYELSIPNRRLALAFGAEEKATRDWTSTRKPPVRPKPVPGADEEERY